MGKFLLRLACFFTFTVNAAAQLSPEQFAALTAQIRLIAEAVGRRF